MHNRRVSDTAAAARLIAAAARDHLQPLGLQRRRRTRNWFEDRNWWIIHVEFQPARGRTGTYLNVGAMWLWTDQDYWSFDEGSRLYWRDDGSFTSTVPLGQVGWTTFLDFLSAEQFSCDIVTVADIAAQRVGELRAQFPDPRSVADYLASRTTRADESQWWHAYHCGAAAGLSGDTVTASDRFGRIVPGELAVQWEQELARTAAQLNDLARDPHALSQRLGRMIEETRQRLKLPPASRSPKATRCVEAEIFVSRRDDRPEEGK